MISKIRQKLKEVIDPELGINIIDLGLVYTIRYEKEVAFIEMTLTFPGCPLGFIIEKAVKQYVGSLDKVKEVNLRIVWEPAWTTAQIHPEIRAQLGLK